MSLWQANVKPLKIFQAKFKTLNSIRTAKQATHEDHGMQVSEEHEFVHGVVPDCSNIVCEHECWGRWSEDLQDTNQPFRASPSAVQSI